MPLLLCKPGRKRETWYRLSLKTSIAGRQYHVCRPNTTYVSNKDADASSQKSGILSNIFDRRRGLHAWVPYLDPVAVFWGCVRFRGFWTRASPNDFPISKHPRMWEGAVYVSDSARYIEADSVEERVRLPGIRVFCLDRSGGADTSGRRGRKIPI